MKLKMMLVLAAVATAHGVTPPPARAQDCFSCEIRNGVPIDCIMTPGVGYKSCVFQQGNCVLQDECDPQRIHLTADGTLRASRATLLRGPEVTELRQRGMSFTRGCRGAIVQRFYTPTVALSKREATDVIVL
jgi:hypothetical protein